MNEHFSLADWVDSGSQKMQCRRFGNTRRGCISQPLRCPRIPSGVATLTWLSLWSLWYGEKCYAMKHMRLWMVQYSGKFVIMARRATWTTKQTERMRKRNKRRSEEGCSYRVFIINQLCSRRNSSQEGISKSPGRHCHTSRRPSSCLALQNVTHSLQTFIYSHRSKVRRG